MWTLLLLAATVRSFAHMPLGISNRNKMVRWPGCEGRAEFSLHTNNVRSLRFVVKIRGCCCNPSVVLRWLCDSPRTGCPWRTTPYIHVARTRNNRVIMACESIVACCHGAKFCAYAARDFRSQHYIAMLVHKPKQHSKQYTGLKYVIYIEMTG